MVTRESRTCALFRLGLADRRFGPPSRMGGRADLGIWVNVHHPDLDQLWPSLPFGNRCEAYPGMRSPTDSSSFVTGVASRLVARSFRTQPL